MFDRILVPLDGSPFSETALPLATDLARRMHATLHLLLIHEPPGLSADVPASLTQEIEGAILSQEQAYLARCANQARTVDGVQVVDKLLDGKAASAIQEYVSANQIELVVMTSHGRGGFRRFCLGSVADTLVRSLEVPILVIRSRDGAPERLHAYQLHRVLVAYDGSELALNAFRAALNLCHALEASCIVMRVVSPPLVEHVVFVPEVIAVREAELERRKAAATESLKSCVEMARDAGVSVETRLVVDSDPADAILRRATEDDANLMVLATRGQQPLPRWLIGSVADKVIRGAAVPVLVCPEGVTFTAPVLSYETEELEGVEIC